MEDSESECLPSIMSTQAGWFKKKKKKNLFSSNSQGLIRCKDYEIFKSFVICLTSHV